jgi:hypothetical protein
LLLVFYVEFKFWCPIMGTVPLFGPRGSASPIIFYAGLAEPLLYLFRALFYENF